MRNLVLVLLAASAWAAAPANLVENRKSDYAIVVASDASPSERHAAAELQSFLERISGARLPVVNETRPRMIVVGRGPALDALSLSIPFDRLGPEGFALKTAGPHLAIAGGRLRGTLYGVYSFLETLGCRWFTADVSRIPSLATIPLPALDETRKPSFEYREPFFREATDPDWAARNKANGATMRLDETRGGKVRYYPFVHSFEQLVPPSKYFKEHPEYFSLIDGKRRAERSQLCLTNPDVLRIGIESVERWIAEHPEATILSVSQNDWTGWCECENCRRVEQEEGGVHQGPVLRYVNALAEEIEKRHPDKLIDTLAYWYTEEPPAKVRPRRNVRIRLCPIGVCVAHPFEQCKYSAYFMNNLRAWSKITDQLYIWHYNTNFAHYLLPFPDFDELAVDIPMYQRHGVVGLFMEGSPSQGGGAENAELRSYVMARLMWDVKTDVERDINEFHEAYYGKAAKPMRAYFDLLQQQVRGGNRHLWIYDFPTAAYLNDDFLKRSAALFRQAETLADTDAVRARVRKARLSLDYVQFARAKRFRVTDGWYRPPDLGGLKARWITLLETMRGYGMTHIRESAPMARDEQDFQTWVRPYRVATLENQRLRMQAVPDLDGRIVQLLDKRTGRDLLRHPEPASSRYPNLGGITVGAYPDFVSRGAFPTKWALAAGSPKGTVVLEGTAENGLKLRRTLRLEGSFLRTETTLENPGAAPIEALLQSRWEVDPGELEGVFVRYRSQAGVDVDKQLIVPEKQPSGTEFYSASEQPAGTWKVAALVNRFPQEQVARCFLNWTLKSQNLVGMAVASHRKVLGPGEKIVLAADYGVE